ncbi:acyl-CoA dehydrogenase family protein [Novipirellula artificiosorum]|uniref:Acyl-CoA dehydrogenase n=1 Tax=Novipirellula artificiosorum TaxID=2528016 RepID=A0A5C6E527_9BACT|nr:acyl-CoA dehydrogenase family protein [Novipirellula artificiosorum]TWU42259.1 Acyl-CoA dehydrogenase [Novipirellula artificiosorum]
MANYFLDNQDIQFLFSHIEMQQLAALQERFAENGDADYAPTSSAEAVEDYHRVLQITGHVAATNIAPNAERVDRDGNLLNQDGTVTLHPCVRENLDWMAKADLLGFTVPRKYGGLNCPNLIYTIATEIVARADASFMNIFGLQGIAETVNAYASQEIKDEILPQFAEGKVTGAMVLTEPDAGSDLQAVRLRAHQDEHGNWLLNGVKRFITNGCGEILLTLARSEPEMSDGLGLSLFLSERCDQIKVRHLEKKLGIHGSPTCELVYENAPARLIGERKRGLITYVLALMNGARVGIAAQSLGIAEAAYRLARTYAHTRHQFGMPIEKLPAIAEMVTDMQVAIEAARALTYETSCICDKENNAMRLVEWHADQLEKEELKSLKKEVRQLKRINSMLTPMSKYYASEMCCRVADDAIQVLGGSGYMKDYAAERHLRDARITTIYEGTSQLQIVAAIRGVLSGVFDSWAVDFEQKEYDDLMLTELKQKLITGRSQLSEAIIFVKKQPASYADLAARRLVDGAIAIMTGHLLLDQATNNERKKRVAKRFVQLKMPILKMNTEQVLSGDSMPLDEFQLLAGPVPTTA